MKSKFRRIFPFLTGESKISTEELSDFLDSAVDEVILFHAPALANFALSSYFSRFALESIGRIHKTSPPK